MKLSFYIGILLIIMVVIFSGVIVFSCWKLQQEKKRLRNQYENNRICTLAYEALFEMTSDPSIVLSDKQRIVAINPIAMSQFPSLEALIGKPISELTDPILRKILLEQDYALVAIANRFYRPITIPLFQDRVKYGELLRLVDASGARDEKRLQALQEQIQEIVFEWDLVNGRLSYSPAYERQFGYSVTSMAPEEANRNHYVHPDDMEHLCAVQQDVCKGKPFAELEYRVRKIKNDVSEYSWVHVRAKAVIDFTGQTIAIIGTMVDIDDKKKQAEQKNSSMNYDSLTGLLESSSLRYQAERRQQSIPSHVQCQMLLIDVDKFRDFDRQYGHHSADLVLKEVAGRLHGFFSSRDLVGRIAGDRFLVFRELPLEEEGEDQLNKCLKRLQETLNQPIEILNQTVCITCCIGVALYPQHGKTIDQLVSNVDKAVYVAKQKGSNCTSVYEPPKV